MFCISCIFTYFEYVLYFVYFVSLHISNILYICIFICFVYSRIYIFCIFCIYIYICIYIHFLWLLSSQDPSRSNDINETIAKHKPPAASCPNESRKRRALKIEGAASINELEYRFSSGS